MAERLSFETFQTRFAALNPPPRFAVAVSGGRDSMALAVLCAEFARKNGGDVLALTVDHRLRAESGDEAQQARAWCEALGLKHQILIWEGDKPDAGFQSAARQARYRLLIEAAQAGGCEALLTAHTADDQAETVFMRLARGAGVQGLAGMRRETLASAKAAPPIRLLRPLLDVSRSEVTAFLKSAGQDFIDDPSNLDPAYERIRVRALLAALGEQDLLKTDALVETARKLTSADRCLRAQEDTLFDQFGGCFHGWGGISFERWRDDPSAAGLARRAVFAVSGSDYYCDEKHAGDAVSGLSAGGAATLSGALIKHWDGRLWFLREPSALTGRAGVNPLGLLPLAGPLLWDGRFVVTPMSDTALSIGPVGNGGKTLLGARKTLFQGPAEALATLPGLFSDGELIGAPALPFIGDNRAVARALTQERFHAGIIRFS